MPAPAALGPIAWKVAQFGAVAAVTWYATRNQRQPGPRDIWREHALNDVEEGVETDFERTSDTVRSAAAGRYRRIVRLGERGPGVEVDFSTLARLKLRRVRRGD